MGPRVMMGEWEQRPYAATAKEAGRSSAATSGNDQGKFLMPSCGQCSQPSRPSLRMTAGRPVSAGDGT